MSKSQRVGKGRFTGGWEPLPWWVHDDILRYPPLKEILAKHGLDPAILDTIPAQEDQLDAWWSAISSVLTEELVAEGLEADLEPNEYGKFNEDLEDRLRHVAESKGLKWGA